MAATSTRPLEFREESQTTVEADETRQLLFELLADDGCRAILEATDDEPLSAREVSEACDIPLSTTYRKLDRLTDVGLVEEGVRLRCSGKHTNEYACRVDEVQFSIGVEDGVTMTLDGAGESSDSVC